jgi:hypothetical protein
MVAREYRFDSPIGPAARALPAPANSVREARNRSSTDGSWSTGVAVVGVVAALRCGTGYCSRPLRAEARLLLCGLTCGAGVRERSLVSGVNGPLMARRPGTSFGRERPLGHLKDERLRWLPDVSVLKSPCVRHGPVTDAIK